MKFTTCEINRILGDINVNGVCENSFVFKKVSIDSRTISPEDLFVAIRGKKYDGHNFINEVVKKGVKAVVINQGEENLIPNNYPFWVVRDTKEAYQNLALFIRRKLNIPVVAITGSVGKTTTKEMSLEVLKSYGKIKVSERNNNNEFGVGLTIHSCEGSEKLIVLEMGMRGMGQIEILSKIAEPDIAVITNVGSAHIGILGSRDSIAKAKCEITRYLNPNGVVIIPYGDQLLEKNLKQIWSGRVVRVKIENYDIKKLYISTDKYLLGFYDNLKQTIEVDNKKFKISFKGIHNAINFLYVYAISKELNLTFKNHSEFNFRISNGRNKIINTKKITIMDESYNASPESVKACIEVLLDYPGKHFIILGSMRELGDKSFIFHNEIFQLINNSDVVQCIFLCENELRDKLKNLSFPGRKVLFTNNFKKIIFTVNKMTNKGDYLLIKGSRYWQLDKLIPYIN